MAELGNKESIKMAEVTGGTDDGKGGRAENEPGGVSENGRDGGGVAGMMSPKVEVSRIAPSKGEPAATEPDKTGPGPVSGIGLGMELTSAG
jgi:hypothetical protein